jgi:hypothetical protein
MSAPKAKAGKVGIGSRLLFGWRRGWGGSGALSLATACYAAPDSGGDRHRADYPGQRGLQATCPAGGAIVLLSVEFHQELTHPGANFH